MKICIMKTLEIFSLVLGTLILNLIALTAPGSAWSNEIQGSKNWTIGAEKTMHILGDYGYPEYRGASLFYHQDYFLKFSTQAGSKEGTQLIIQPNSGESVGQYSIQIPEAGQTVVQFEYKDPQGRIKSGSLIFTDKQTQSKSVDFLAVTLMSPSNPNLIYSRFDLSEVVNRNHQEQIEIQLTHNGGRGYDPHQGGYGVLITIDDSGYKTDIKKKTIQNQLDFRKRRCRSAPPKKIFPIHTQWEQMIAALVQPGPMGCP